MNVLKHWPFLARSHSVIAFFKPETSYNDKVTEIVITNVLVLDGGNESLTLAKLNKFVGKAKF